jgi:HlyD family secretion protein
MRRKIIWFLLFIITLALAYWMLRPRPIEVEVGTLVQGTFERAIEEEGKTRLRERYLVSSPVAGRLQRIEIKQGDMVPLGATVASLWPADPGLLDARTRAEHQARLGALQAGVQSSLALVASTEAELNQARIDLQRIRTLSLQGFIGSSQTEQAELKVKQRDKEHEVAIQSANAARAELAQLQITMQDYASQHAESRKPSYQIKAPVAGRVFKLLLESESMVSAGTHLLELGDPAQLEVEVALLTEDAAQVPLGAPVELLRWGGAGVVSGNISAIEPSATTKISALGVEEQRVKAIITLNHLPDGFEQVGDGYKVDVRIIVQSAENALMVPVSALFPAGSRAGLFTVHDGTAVLQEIKVIARNPQFAWIEADLSAGTTVVVYPNNQLRSGAKVTLVQK